MPACRSSYGLRCARRLVDATLLAFVVAALTQSAALAQTRPFPFDHELRFDADPLRGSKRVPGLLIDRSGAAEIDLWCVRGTGQAVIADNSITIVPTALRDERCPPDRLLKDKELLDQLTQVTRWRWEGHVLLLIGPQTLRYRPATN
jgi:heat shock protein HslJ